MSNEFVEVDDVVMIEPNHTISFKENDEYHEMYTNSNQNSNSQTDVVKRLKESIVKYQELIKKLIRDKKNLQMTINSLQSQNLRKSSKDLVASTDSIAFNARYLEEASGIREAVKKLESTLDELGDKLVNKNLQNLQDLKDFPKIKGIRNIKNSFYLIGDGSRVYELKEVKEITQIVEDYPEEGQKIVENFFESQVKNQLADRSFLAGDEAREDEENKCDLSVSD